MKIGPEPTPELRPKAMMAEQLGARGLALPLQPDPVGAKGGLLARPPSEWRNKRRPVGPDRRGPIFWVTMHASR